MLKKTIVLMTILLITVGINVAQNRKDSRNVLDYFKQIPKDREFFHTAILSEKSTKIEIKDTKNGYLKIRGDFEGWIEVALFRKMNRSPILLVTETTCGPACGTDIFAYKLKRGKMVFATGEIIPELTEDEAKAKFRRNRNDSNAEIVSYLYNLPRKGKTTRITEDVSGELIYEMKWKNDKFIIHRSILDYYHLIPQNELASENSRNGQILINDSKNGYLKMKVPGSTLEVALFRKTDGTAVLVYTENYCGRPRCVTTEITAQEYVKGEWKDVTDKIIPDQAEIERDVHSKSSYAAKYGYQYKIPHVGTTIKIVEGEDGKVIYKLKWKENKFVVQ